MSSYKHSDEPLFVRTPKRPIGQSYDVSPMRAGEGFCAATDCVAVVEGARQLCDEHAIDALATVD